VPRGVFAGVPTTTEIVIVRLDLAPSVSVVVVGGLVGWGVVTVVADVSKGVPVEGVSGIILIGVEMTIAEADGRSGVDLETRAGPARWPLDETCAPTTTAIQITAGQDTPIVNSNLDATRDTVDLPRCCLSCRRRRRLVLAFMWCSPSRLTERPERRQATPY
jgi:hypothetical protein